MCVEWLWKGDVHYMVQILPFAGWRYDLSQVGALSEVTCPPSALVDEALQRTLYRQHPCNAVRLVMNRDEPGDTSPTDRSSRASDFWRLWKREGVLLREHESAFYIIETSYQFASETRSRWSVIARLRLPDSSARTADIVSVVAGESQRAAELAELRRVCKASLIPVVALLEDTTGADSDDRSLSDHFETLVRQMPPIECIEDDGTRHRMWPMTHQTGRTELASRIANLTAFVVSGMNEYLAAISNRERNIAEDPNDPSQTTLVCLIPADDPGLEILPQMWLHPASTVLSGEQLRQLLSHELICHFVGTEPAAGEDATELARLSSQQPCVAVGTCDGVWMIVSRAAVLEDRSSNSLVKQISRLVSEQTSVPDRLVCQRGTLSGNGLAGFLNRLLHSKAGGLVIVEPAMNAATLIAGAMSGHTFPEESVQVHPYVPSGLVFSSISHSQP